MWTPQEVEVVLLESYSRKYVELFIDKQRGAAAAPQNQRSAMSLKRFEISIKRS